MLTLMLSAWAGAPVLNLADVEAPEAQIAAAATVAPETLTTLTLAALTQREARLDGEGTLSWCATAPTDLATLRARVDEAEASTDGDATASALDDAIEGMSCLSEPIDPDWAGRVYALRGIAAHQSGMEDDALGSFRHAFTFAPDLTWEEAFPPEAKELFDQARAASQEGDTVTVTVRPSFPVWVDGRERSGDLELAPGNHLLQLGPTSAVLQVLPETSPQLVIPAALTSFERFNEGAREDLGLVLGEDPLYVVGPESLWRWDGASWALLGETIPDDAQGSIADAVPPEEQGRLHPVTYTGMALLGIGAVSATSSRVRAANAANGANNAESWEEYQSYAYDYSNFVWATQLGLGVTAAGAVLTGTGVVLTVTR